MPTARLPTYWVSILSGRGFVECAIRFFLFWGQVSPHRPERADLARFARQTRIGKCAGHQLAGTYLFVVGGEIMPTRGAPEECTIVPTHRGESGTAGRPQHVTDTKNRATYNLYNKGRCKISF